MLSKNNLNHTTFTGNATQLFKIELTAARRRKWATSCLVVENATEKEKAISAAICVSRAPHQPAVPGTAHGRLGCSRQLAVPGTARSRLGCTPHTPWSRTSDPSL